MLDISIVYCTIEKLMVAAIGKTATKSLISQATKSLTHLCKLACVGLIEENNGLFLLDTQKEKVLFLFQRFYKVIMKITVCLRNRPLTQLFPY